MPVMPRLVRPVRFASVIVMCSVLSLTALTGCGLWQTPQSPYLREVKAAFDEHGQPDPNSYRINKPYMQHLLKDLEACYAETR